MPQTFEVCPQVRERIMGGIHHLPGSYIALMDMRLTKLEPGYAEGEMLVSEKTNNYRDNVHGGALAGFADTIAGIGACADNKGVVTVDCSVHYLRPASGPKLTCKARAQKLGRTLRVFEVEITDSKGETVATGIFTFFVTGEPVVPGLGKET